MQVFDGAPQFNIHRGSMKLIRVKATGVETTVPDEYFERYEKEGWFIEIVEEKKKPKAPKVEQEKPKLVPKNITKVEAEEV